MDDDVVVNEKGEWDNDIFLNKNKIFLSMKRQLIYLIFSSFWLVYLFALYCRSVWTNKRTKWDLSKEKFHGNIMNITECL
jgi:hypothetical protein